VQIKKKFPAVTVAVDKDRIEGCDFLCHPELLQTSKKARKCVHKEMEPAEIIVLDDAFQYRRLKAAYNIVLVDYNRPLDKDMLLPLGRLRDLPSRLRAADAVIITKCPHYMEDEDRAEFLAGLGYKDFDPVLCEATNRKGGLILKHSHRMTLQLHLSTTTARQLSCLSTRASGLTMSRT
ncbi:MAG: tetraacyldisaccharide 4'-kinase, partial [Clostridiales bacterium]|nr:tetraacyldisaccharide 4'-kinase [Clostridiales bacterium]